MWLKYLNLYHSGLWLAVGYYDPGCYKDCDWASRGWWRLEPGQSATVLWTTNNYSTYYAEADDGACWAGPYVVTLPFNAFEEFCWDFGVHPGLQVGMRLVHATNAWWAWTGTIRLI